MKTSRAHDLVAGTIRRRILSGDLRPGDSLPTESTLISELGVSRETVRMALRLLDAEGLTETSQGRSGVRIRHPEPERVARSLVQLLTLTGATWDDLLAFRSLVEPGAAALVAEHASQQEKAEIAELAGRGIAQDGTGYHEFHHLIARASGNPVLATVLAATEQAVSWATADSDISQFDRDEAARSHRAVAEAITAGDSPKAELRMRKHLEAARRHMESAGRAGDPLVPPSRWRGEDRNLPWR